MIRYSFTATFLIVIQVGFLCADDTTTTDQATASSNYASESIRGRVVWLAEALKRRYDIKVMADADERVMALETKDGKLYPFVEDLRGRSFRKDERLRNMADVELFVRRYKNPDVVQVIRIYEYRPQGKYIVDYWCDICAIVMFEDGPCDCCQDHNRMRKRMVGDLNSEISIPPKVQ